MTHDHQWFVNRGDRAGQLVELVRSCRFAFKVARNVLYIQRFHKIVANFLHNIFAASQESSIMAGIGATAPRLHGFHRFLPRLWELFFGRVFQAI